MGRLKTLKILIFFLIISGPDSHAQVIKRSSCNVPLQEQKSAPAIDLIDQNQKPIDRDRIIDLIRKGEDTSVFQPQLSDLFVNTPLQAVSHGAEFPDADALSVSPLEFISSIEADHLTQARVTESSGRKREYRLSVTYDLNAALARNALLRKLGYAIPSPRYYSKLPIRFKDADTRDGFLSRIARMRDPSRWLNGGKSEYDQKSLTITLINVALEPSLIGSIPPLHWGIFKPEVIQSRRSLRALLVPLTLLEIDESANMFSFEPAKIENDQLVFSRVYANSFKNETTIGDARWIGRRIATLTRKDWQEIIQAGQYPDDIEALLLEKTIGRVQQLLRLLGLPENPELSYDPEISIGAVILGKATQTDYPGYPHYFAYGDPLNPLRLAEIIRYFTVEGISSGIKLCLDQMNQWLQVRGQDHYIDQHTAKLQQDILNHIQKNPNQPYIQPVSAFGGPIAGGSITAGRSVIAGTYFGSESPVQLIDTLSASARVGAFVGISGIRNLGIGFTPNVNYTRSYVHVRPIADMKTALKTNWLNVAVPYQMAKLSNHLLQKDGEDSAAAIDRFLNELKPGEMIIVMDGFTLGNNTMAGIPLGAALGLGPLASNISETININQQYAILSRTTLYKSKDGLQVYLTGIHSKTHDISADTQFFVKLFNLSGLKTKGTARTQAFILPESFNTENERTDFQKSIRQLLRTNQSDQLEANFRSYRLDHESRGGRSRIKIGPWQWTRREILNRHSITPPRTDDSGFDPTAYRRTVIQGQINRIRGSDAYGFFGGILNQFFRFINLGGSGRGDDPSTNFFGKSRTLVVSTELETTAHRKNNTLVRIQETHSGWSLRKQRLLKLIRAISDRVPGFIPNGGLIDEDSFTQTRKVQSYQLMWNLAIYEPGLDRLFDLLDSSRSSTAVATEKMIQLMGQNEFLQFCKSNGIKPGISSTDLDWDRLDLSAVETINGKTSYVSCITPWMRTIYDLRHRLSKKSGIFHSDIHQEDLAKIKVESVNEAILKLERDLDLSLLIKLVGVENTYFQVSVVGYRKGDERAQDEEGRSTYFSNTIGAVNTTIRNGPLDDIGNSSSILQHELSARYLSDGY
jgi:hypothetical protein